MSEFIHIKEAIKQLNEGKMLIVQDDEHRENEGDLMVAAEKVTPEVINFMMKHGRGLVCMPMAGALLDQIGVPMMVKHNQSVYKTPFTVTIGAAKGIDSGISAEDRAHTVHVAIDKGATPDDVVMPGHVFPLRAQEGGVLVRAGHTEASVDLARLAGLRPAAVICETLNDEGRPARGEELEQFAATYNIKRVSIQDLITHRINHENFVEEVAASRIPLEKWGEFQIRVFKNRLDNVEHVVLMKGDITKSPCLVRFHSECLTGEVFGSSRCDCGWQLDNALEKINKEGGVLIYARQEGRGIGLANKIRAYALQDEGLDTVEANHKLGFQADQRNYGIGAQILRQLNVKTIRLMTNNPKKVEQLEHYNIHVAGRDAIEMMPTKDNITYLKTKRDKLGHLLSIKEEKAV